MIGIFLGIFINSHVVMNRDWFRLGGRGCSKWICTSIKTNMFLKVRDDVLKHQDMYSLLYVPHPFVIPGGRFREFYYWWVALSFFFLFSFSSVCSLFIFCSLSFSPRFLFISPLSSLSLLFSISSSLWVSLLSSLYLFFHPFSVSSLSSSLMFWGINRKTV